MKEKRTLKHISDEEIRTTLAISSNWAECCRLLGLSAMTGTQSHFKARCIKLELDFSHFIRNTNNGGGKKKKPIEEYLIGDCSLITSHKLKKKLFSHKLKDRKCEMCGLEEWNGNPAPLELDHKDSNHFNNNLDNLQILCANCHSVETSKRRLNRKKLKPPKFDVLTSTI